jgi:CspA family cold shock protein
MLTFPVLFIEERNMPQGTIKKLTQKGFGFIEGEKGDLFFHESAVEGTTFEELSEGQQVEYTEGQGPKGPRAENVKLV